MDKVSLRRIVRQRRRGLSPETTQRAGDLIADPFFLSLPPFANAKVIAGYLSIPGELPPEPLLKRCYDAGKTLALPAWEEASQSYLFSLWTPDAPLEEGPCHVLQPATLRPLPFSAIDTLLVPGLAFDRFGGRIGFGGGYYDRLLAQCRKDAHFCALAFEWQLFETVPSEPHDIRMDFLLLPGTRPFHVAINPK